METVLFVAAIVSGIVGGIFYAFSSFVMPALSRIPAPEGIRAMQRINIDVFHWSFMGLFFGMPALCLGIAIASAWKVWGSGTPFALTGALVYLLGCFFVTVVGNVPRNNALAQVEASEEAAEGVWHDYLRVWTRWNTLRTVACIVAAVAFTTSLLVP